MPENESSEDSRQDLEQTGEFLSNDVPDAAGGEDVTLFHRTEGDTASPSPSPELSIGETAAFGDYQLEGELARGGMGVVFRANQLSLNRPVALKMILSGNLASDEDVRRFYSEAEAAAKLDHPNIVPIYEVGKYDSTHYFSMKLIEGGDLGQKLLELRNDLKQAVELLRKVCLAVDHAHQRGVLHRDIKPANILIDQEGEPFVTDLGLARSVGTDSKLTKTGAIVGTPSYMSPEQAAGDADLTIASDVYSLGAILYEVLTGRPPFRGNTPMETLLQVLNNDPLKPSDSGATDRNLEQVALKCLSKDPKQRYASASELAGDLQRWLNGEPLTIRTASVTTLARNWIRQNFGSAIWIPIIGAGCGLFAGVFIWLATAHKEVAIQRQEVYEKIISQAAPPALITWIPPSWFPLPAMILFTAALALLGFFTALLVKTKNSSADVAAGLAVGTMGACVAFMFAMATMSISSITDRSDVNLLAMLGRTPQLETPLPLIDQYPEMEDLSRRDQIQLLYSKIMVDRTFAISKGLLFGSGACLLIFVFAGMMETYIAGKAIRKHDSWWKALAEYTFCSFPYVFGATYVSLHLAAYLLLGQPGFVFDGISLAILAAIVLAIVAQWYQLRLWFRVPIVAFAAVMMVFYFNYDFSILPKVARNRALIATSLRKAEHFPENMRLKADAAGDYQSAGVALFNSGRWRTARAFVQSGRNYIESIDPKDRNFALNRLLALSYSNDATLLWVRGREEQAVKLILDAATEHKGNSLVQEECVEFLTEVDRPELAQRVIDAMMVVDRASLRTLQRAFAARASYGLAYNSPEQNVALEEAADDLLNWVSVNVKQPLSTRLQETFPSIQTWEISYVANREEAAEFQNQMLLDATSDLQELNSVQDPIVVKSFEPLKIRLHELFPASEDNVVGFASAVILSPKEQQCDIAIGSDDGFSVWVNEQKVADKLRSRAYAERDEIFPFSLRQGRNRILVRIDQLQGDWEFSIQIDEKDGLPARLTWLDPSEKSDNGR